MRGVSLKTNIRVAAHLRRAQSAGAFAVVARKGDPDAGAVAVKVFLERGRAHLFLQSRDLDGASVWRNPFAEDGADIVKAVAPEEANDAARSAETALNGAAFEAADEAAIDDRLAREASFDPDLWVIEIEDRHGRAFLV